MSEDHQVKQNHKNDNLKIKVSTLLLLFVTVIMVSVIIILSNYFDIMNQNNLHLDKEIVTGHNYYGEADIEIQNKKDRKRILSDTQINTWNVNNQTNSKVSTLSDGNFVVIWQSYLQDDSSVYSIYGQIFYSNGIKKGTEFHASNSTALNQTNPNVAASSGKFMVI